MTDARSIMTCVASLNWKLNIEHFIACVQPQVVEMFIVIFHLTLSFKKTILTCQCEGLTGLLCFTVFGTIPTDRHTVF